MLLSQEVSQGVEVLAVTGPVHGPDAALLKDALGQAAGACPRGVVIDLTGAAVAHVDDRPEAQVSVQATLTCGPEGPGEARRLAAQCAEANGFDGDDLAVVVTELVTNAVRHGTPPIELEIDTREDCVTVVVADAGGGRPVQRAAGNADEGGRGLLLVDLLAAASGVRPAGTGKAVWAELPRHR